MRGGRPFRVSRWFTRVRAQSGLSTREVDVDQTSERQAFTRFVKATEPKLSIALGAAYGPEIGREATEEALVWAWEHWPKVRKMSNAAGYLYRVGQSKARWYQRPPMLFPARRSAADRPADLDLVRALERLSLRQRAVVVLIHAYGYPEREVADLLGSSRWSVRTHLERGLQRLRDEMGVTVDA